jgi:hypothetical protein
MKLGMIEYHGEDVKEGGDVNPLNPRNFSGAEIARDYIGAEMMFNWEIH